MKGKIEGGRGEGGGERGRKTKSLAMNIVSKIFAILAIRSTGKRGKPEVSNLIRINRRTNFPG